MIHGLIAGRDEEGADAHDGLDEETGADAPVPHDVARASAREDKGLLEEAGAKERRRRVVGDGVTGRKRLALLRVGQARRLVRGGRLALDRARRA